MEEHAEVKTDEKFKIIMYSVLTWIAVSDIDECELGIDRCDQNCHNNIGSYTCSCNAGWRLDFDGFRCNGI